MANPPEEATFQYSDNLEKHRFELRVGGALAAFSGYNVLKTGLLFTHTEVLPAFEGRGIGAAMAQHALDVIDTSTLLTSISGGEGVGLS